MAQKGFDVLAHALDRILGWGCRWCCSGTGDPTRSEFFAWADAYRGDRFRAWLKFDNGRAHRIEAGSDFFLMPSRFEPCGLNQMYSLRYGTLPIVRATGGLVDTVQNYHEASASGTGFMFTDLNPGLARQHHRLGALDLVRPPRAHRSDEEAGHGSGLLLGARGRGVPRPLPASVRETTRARVHGVNFPGKSAVDIAPHELL